MLRRPEQCATRLAIYDGRFKVDFTVASRGRLQDATTDGELDVWHIGIHLRDWVEPATSEDLLNAFGGFDADDSWHALDATTARYGRLARDTAQAHELHYPQSTEDGIIACIDSVRTS